MSILEQGYGIIPKAIMKDHSLNVYEKCILAYFLSYTGAGKNQCWPKVSQIMEDLQISSATLTKNIKSLCDKGFIKKEERHNNPFDRSLIYTLLMLDVEFSPDESSELLPDENSSPTPDENSLNKNILNINKKNNKPTRIKFGENKSVLLTQDEYDKLVIRWGKKYTESMIEKMDGYITAKGTKYKNFYQALINWSKNEYNKQSSITEEVKITTPLFSTLTGAI